MSKLETIDKWGCDGRHLVRKEPHLACAFTPPPSLLDPSALSSYWFLQPISSTFHEHHTGPVFLKTAHNKMFPLLESGSRQAPFIRLGLLKVSKPRERCPHSRDGVAGERLLLGGPGGRSGLSMGRGPLYLGWAESWLRAGSTRQHLGCSGLEYVSGASLGQQVILVAPEGRVAALGQALQVWQPPTVL